MGPEINTSPTEDGRHHTYISHAIPWYVRALWVAYWVGSIWYIVKFAIPMARNYFR